MCEEAMPTGERGSLEKPRPAMGWEIKASDGRGLAEQIMRGSRRVSIREIGWAGRAGSPYQQQSSVPTLATGARSTVVKAVETPEESGGWLIRQGTGQGSRSKGRSATRKEKGQAVLVA